MSTYNQMKSANTEFAACTIIAKNYLPMARALASRGMPPIRAAPFFVLLLDSPHGFFDPAKEEFETVLASELDIPNLSGFLFKYTILEASTAVKPYLLEYLFERYAIEKLLYLDPDILVFRPLDPLRESLEISNILLTPHLCSPLPNDGLGQTEHDILQAGTYNLGFIGLRNSLETKRLLRWWSEKLYHHCVVSFAENLFVDQRWMDMVPACSTACRSFATPDSTRRTGTCTSARFPWATTSRSTRGRCTSFTSAASIPTSRG